MIHIKLDENKAAQNCSHKSLGLGRIFVHSQVLMLSKWKKKKRQEIYVMEKHPEITKRQMTRLDQKHPEYTKYKQLNYRKTFWIMQ